MVEIRAQGAYAVILLKELHDELAAWAINIAIKQQLLLCRGNGCDSMCNKKHVGERVVEIAQASLKCSGNGLPSSQSKELS